MNNDDATADGPAEDPVRTAERRPVARRQAGEQPVSAAVVEALSAAAGVEPGEFDPPLYDAVDPDALDRLFTTTEGGRVVFTVADWRVAVTADGNVSVYRQADGEAGGRNADHRPDR